MVLAAARMLWSSRLMSRSADSEAPIAFSCSRRWPRSSPASAAASRRIPWVDSAVLLMGAWAPRSLDADRAHFLEARHAQQALFQSGLLQGAHALLERRRDQLRHARLLGNQLLQGIG